MTRVCMHCGHEFGTKESDREGITHGICPQCASKGLEEVETKTGNKCYDCGIELDAIGEGDRKGQLCRKCEIKVEKSMEEQRQAMERRKIENRGKKQNDQ